MVADLIALTPCEDHTPRRTDPRGTRLDEWQLLLLEALPAGLAKAEIFRTSHWRFAEYVYREEGKKQTLVAARSVLLDRCPRLEIFFKSEDEIRRGL
jgi:hypothetical protein